MKKKMAVVAIAACVAFASVGGSAGTGALEVSASPKLTLASEKEEEETAEKETAEEETEEEVAEEAAEEETEEETQSDDASEDEMAEDVEEEAEEESEEETAEEETVEEEAEEEPFEAVGFSKRAVITVTGTGSVMVSPDSASISIGVETTGNSSRAAQEENIGTVNSVIDALVEAGVEEKNIKTDSFDIYTNYDYSGETVELAGYIVSSYLTISNIDIDGIGDLLDVATDAGANCMNGIYYSYSNAQEAYDQALEAALERAQQKAGVIAAKQGAQLGAVVSIEEEDTQYSVSDARVATYSEVETVTEDTVLNVMGGESEVSATVTVTYSLESSEEE